MSLEKATSESFALILYEVKFMKVAKIFLRKGFEWLGTSFLVASSILNS